MDAAIAQSHVPGAYRRALSVKYVPTTDQIAFQLDDGVEVRLPRKKLQGLEHATATQIKQIKIMGPGTGLVWPARDVAHGIPGLIDGVFGTRRHMAEIARAGGSKKSAAKAKAAKENGRLGGRPKTSTAKAKAQSQDDVAVPK